MHFGNNGSIIVNRLKIHPHISVSYNQNIGQRMWKNIRPEKNTSKGKVSSKARSRIIAALNWMKLMSDEKWIYSTSKSTWFSYRLGFITLTLPIEPQYDDQYILDHLLQPFLLWLQRKKNCWNYVWKAEIQGKRFETSGQRCIHFHITVNKFVHWSEIQGKWTDLLRNHKLLGTSDGSAASQIKSVINENKILYYFSKYMAKTADKKELVVNCKTWGCNYNLSRMNCLLEEEVTPEYWDNSNEMLQKFTRGKKMLDHSTVYFNKFTRASSFPPEVELQMIRNYELFTSKDDGEQVYMSM